MRRLFANHRAKQLINNFGWSGLRVRFIREPVTQKVKVEIIPPDGSPLTFRGDISSELSNGPSPWWYYAEGACT